MHSPGPWRVVPIDQHHTGDLGDGISVVAADGETIADNQRYYPQALDPKNAPLIAAAPELWELLVELENDGDLSIAQGLRFEHLCQQIEGL